MRRWSWWRRRKVKIMLKYALKPTSTVQTRWTNLLKVTLDCSALFDACEPKECPKISKCDGTRFAGSFTTELKPPIEHPQEQTDKRYC